MNNTDYNNVQTTNKYGKNKTIDKHSVYMPASTSGSGNQVPMDFPEEIFNALHEIENCLVKAKECQSNLERNILTLSVLLEVYNKK